MVSKLYPNCLPAMVSPNLAFKCRRCRQYLFGDESVLTTSKADSEPTNVIQQYSVWYLNEESPPQWVQEAIEKAQWTKGKLNCLKCQGRLGQFDFVSLNKTQLNSAIFSPIQVTRTRVDCESTSSRIVQNLRIADQKHHSIESLPSKAVTDAHKKHSIIASLAEATAFVTETAIANYDHQSSVVLERDDMVNHRTENFKPDPISQIGQDLHEYGCENDSTAAGVVCQNVLQGLEDFDKRDLEKKRGDVEDTVVRKRLHSAPDNHGTELNEVIDFIGTSFDGEDSASWEDFFEEIIQEMHELRFSSGNTGGDYLGPEENLDVLHDLDTGRHSRVSQGACERTALKKERNRRKKERRKQRRKERWMECQDGALTNVDEQELDLSGLFEVLGTDWSPHALKEVTTCSICLDVFYQPHTCHPCNHIFCEPCLRQLASVHPVVAPCPLCRACIRTVIQHCELTAAIKKLFPSQTQRRMQAERRTLHRSFPLPGHSAQGSVSRPWFNFSQFRTSDTDERVRQFTSRVNRPRQRQQQLYRTVFQEASSETVATLLFFAVFVGVVMAFLTLMQEFT